MSETKNKTKTKKKKKKKSLTPIHEYTHNEIKYEQFKTFSIRKNYYMKLFAQ